MKTIISNIIFLFILCGFAQPVNAQFKIGDKVEAYNIQWYKATVIGFGTGDLSGYIKVHYDDYSSASDQYLKASSIRPLQKTQATNSAMQTVNSQFKIGDKVEAWNIQWYKATVIGFGTGDLAGYIKVHYDDYSSASDQYLKASNIRAVQKAQTLNAATGPRNGRYTILSYGNIYNPITLGYFDLNNGKYIYYSAGKRPIGSGTYLYDAATRQVTWQSGPLKDYGATAGFEIDREGKTHKIRLKNSTIGTNSSDSK